MARYAPNELVPVTSFIELIKIMKADRTWKDLSSFTGLTEGHIVNILNGLYKTISKPTALKILAAYKRHKQTKVQS